MSIKMHFTGYRTAHLQIQLANVHTYYNPNYTRKNKSKYSLTSPYGHLYNTDTSLLRTVWLVPEMPKIIHCLPL